MKISVSPTHRFGYHLVIGVTLNRRFITEGLKPEFIVFCFFDGMKRQWWEMSSSQSGARAHFALTENVVPHFYVSTGMTQCAEKRWLDEKGTKERGEFFTNILPEVHDKIQLVIDNVYRAGTTLPDSLKHIGEKYWNNEVAAYTLLSSFAILLIVGFVALLFQFSAEARGWLCFWLSVPFLCLFCPWIGMWSVAASESLASLKSRVKIKSPPFKSLSLNN